MHISLLKKISSRLMWEFESDIIIICAVRVFFLDCWRFLPIDKIVRTVLDFSSVSFYRSMNSKMVFLKYIDLGK